MKKLTNTDAELQKNVAYTKEKIVTKIHSTIEECRFFLNGLTQELNDV